MIIGAENDTVAPVSSHAEPFYTSLSAAPDKAYLELNNASHSAPTSANTTVARYSISWLKRFVDDDHPVRAVPLPRPRVRAASSRNTGTRAPTPENAR